MNRSIRLCALLAFCTASLSGQTAPESPVGLVTEPQAAKLFRANTSLGLTARVGDILFVGDALRSTGLPVSFVYCPGQFTATLSAGGWAVFEPGRVRLKTGRLSGKQPRNSCFLPATLRVSLASQQHYGVSLTRPLQVAPPGMETFAKRLQALPPDVRSALVGELAPIDRALAANESDPVARIGRAALLEKYNLRIDASIEYRKVLQAWPQAVWILSRLFELEDQPPPQKSEPPTKGRTLALLVGISKYKSQRITPLLYAARDALLFEEFLRSPRGGSVAEADLQLLTDERATVPAIQLAITDFLKVRAGKKDTVVLFIAAHGTVESKTGKAYIITHETEPEALAGTALAMANLQQLFRKELAGVGRVLVYLDACHAGELGAVGITSINDAVTPLTQAGGEIFSFMATGKDEKSEEGPQYGGGHGSFSFFVVDGLNGAADTDPEDGKVDFNEFIDYVRRMVRQSTERRQNPDHSGNLGKAIMSETGNVGLALARFPAGVEVAMSAPPRIRGLDTNAAAGPQGKAFEDALAAGRLLPEEPNSAFAALPALRAAFSPAEYLDQENRLRVALENKGREVLLQYLRGQQAPQHRGDFTSGAAYFTAAQRLSPESLLLESQKAFCLGRAALFAPKDYNAAFDLLERAARLDPTSAYSYNALGIAYLERASYREAEVAFRDAVRLSPYWIYPRHNLALTYSELGAYTAAEREYREAIRLGPRYSYLHYSLGALLQKLGRARDAESEYRAAIGIDPAQAEPYVGLGALKAGMGKNLEAEQNYSAAIRLNPKLAAAGHDLALLYRKEKKTSLAIQTWQENLERNPDFTPSRMSLADVYRQENRFDDAIAQYRSVLSLSPSYGAANMALHESLGDRYRRDGQLDQVRQEYQQALSVAASDGDRRRIQRKMKK